MTKRYKNNRKGRAWIQWRSVVFFYIIFLIAPQGIRAFIRSAPPPPPHQSDISVQIRPHESGYPSGAGTGARHQGILSPNPPDSLQRGPRSFIRRIDSNALNPAQPVGRGPSSRNEGHSGETPLQPQPEAEHPLVSALLPVAGEGSLVKLMLILALSTLVSEDLTCIGAGMLAARGSIGFFPATVACFIGILLGDIMLYLAGRFIGRPALRYPPLKWLIKDEDIDRSSRWFDSKGPVIIFTSRFTPGLRLPTYFSAGVLDMGLSRFLLYFTAAVAIWTPILVGVSSFVGGQIFAYYDLYSRYALWVLFAALLALWASVKLIVPLFSFRGRRLLLSSYLRLTRWEYWRPPVFYLPVIVYCLYLGMRHRSLTLFTASNPGIPEGGFREESKAQILESLKDGNPHIARHRLIRASNPRDRRIRMSADFMQELGLSYPVVIKPDVGQRGEGVAIVHSEEALQRILTEREEDLIVQEYVAGVEYGVFYYRFPDEDSGRILSITAKRLPQLTGDGKSTLEELILRGPDTVGMARFHMRRHRENLMLVLKEGETFPLVEVGDHACGTVFLDGNAVWTPELEAAIDRLSKRFDGFYFGRYDLRTPSIEDFRKGRNFKIVELNGVTSEAAHIYHPGNSIWYAYRILMHQWRLAFEIGAANRKRGVKPASHKRMLNLLFRYARGVKGPAAAAAD